MPYLEITELALIHCNDVDDIFLIKSLSIIRSFT